MVFLCITVCLFILYYALLSQNFEHLLLNKIGLCIVMVIRMYHNVLITSNLLNTTSKARSSDTKNQFQCLVCLLDVQSMFLLFQTFTSNW